ncbi:small ribosomal subunit protein mS38 [Antennarius striatus]|uniref:small ribosomal subunit protein mS38 n=1 Tax=Antennarius striatus TaxID=241820 RepID=UPI0035AEE210
MFSSKVVSRLKILRRVSCTLQGNGNIVNGCVRPLVPAHHSLLKDRLRNYSTAADNTSPPQWVQLEPELDEALIPRKLSVSPLESWLSLRYSLPPLPETVQPQEDIELLEERVLPPISVPVTEDRDDADAPAPLRCKNVLKLRRRMMNRHKYRKLRKRIKFLRRKVLDGRRKKKQKSFEKDLKRLWRKAGLRGPPVGWTAPKVYTKYEGGRG